MNALFESAIHSRKKIRLTFFSKEDNANVRRACAPMDLGPSRRAVNQDNRFHFWDFESDKKNHVLSLLPEQVVAMELLPDFFDPAEFVTWDVKKSPWFVPRDWGAHS